MRKRRLQIEIARRRDVYVCREQGLRRLCYIGKRKIAASHKAADLYDICYNIPVNVTLKKDDEIEIAFKNAEGFGGHRGTGNARIPHGIRGTISFYKSENL